MAAPFKRRLDVNASQPQSWSDLREQAQRTLDLASDRGATAAEVDIGTGRGLCVTVRKGAVETVEHQRDKALSITVYFDGRKGSAGTTDFTDKALRETVDAACTIARYASVDEHAGLIDPRYLARDIPDLDLYHPWDLSAEDAIELAVGCEQHAMAADKRITNSDGTLLNTYSGTHVYGNSLDFLGGWNWSSHSLDCTMIAEERGSMQRDGWYTRARDHLDMEDGRRVGERAAERTSARLGARKLSTRRVPVIFEAPVAASLISAFLGAISGSALYRRASFMLDKLGEPVFADHVRLSEQPHQAKGMGSAPFDNDGMGTCAKDLVTNGVLQTYLLNAYSARRLGMEPTGNAGGVHNLIVSHGDQDRETLLQTMGEGLFITDLIGFGVNQVTGDYSRGASGYWVSGGQIQYPVEEITVAGSLPEMYKQIVDIGSDVDRRGNIQIGSMLIDSMIIAGS